MKVESIVDNVVVNEQPDIVYNALTEDVKVDAVIPTTDKEHASGVHTTTTPDIEMHLTLTPKDESESLYQLSNNSNRTLREKVTLWFADREVALNRYGHISTWDTSYVTNMRDLFKHRIDFNYEEILSWDLNKVEDITNMLYGVFLFDKLFCDNKVSYSDDKEFFSCNTAL